MIKIDYSQLLLDVQKHFGSSINNIAQLKLLQEAIEFETKKHIGFNTLRRFFGFLDFTKPNMNTLNVLSQYVGYSSYGGYQKNNMRDEEWYRWERVVKIELTNTITEADILWLQSQINTHEYHVKIISIIKTFIYRKEYDLLKAFFDDRIFKFEETNRLKLASNVCLIFRTLSTKSINKIIKALSPNIVFRENVLHWFIDYSHLNGYYGSFLSKASPFVRTDSHESLFSDLMTNYTNYLSGKNNFKNIPIDRIKDDFYIVLKGRCYAYNLIYYTEQENTVEYEKTWKAFLKIIQSPEDINLLTVEIFPALLLLKDFDKTNYLIEKYYEDILTLTNWSGYHMQAATLLAITVNSINANKIKEANATFNFINISKFSVSYIAYISLFYLLVKHKLGVANTIPENELQKIENEYVSIVKETGFKRFSVNFLKNY
ncbi:hypothetical protein [Flavobacterium sp. W22_SRS_FP1]|uniref:hypothetical protein n=1 Tax=Flavobacterium sp. W22_SRS_FP1 TaxID=3240276 RepID=UPI003F8EFA9F